MTNANECTCPSGDGSLRHPCPAHPESVELAGVAAKLTFINGRPAMCGCQVEYSSGGGEYSDVIYVTLCAKHSGSAILDLVATNRIALTPEYEGQWHADLYLDREIPLAKAEGATPAEAVLALMSAERIDPEQESVEQAGGDERVIGWRERILAAHPNSDPGFWPDALLVEHMAAEIADLRAALAQPSPAPDLDPLNLAPHAEAFNEAPAEALKPEQAEAERPEVVGSAWRNIYNNGFDHVAPFPPAPGGPVVDEPLMTVAQHERITAQLHVALDESDGDRWKLRSERDAANARLHEVATACATAEQERDAALAEVERLIGVCASLDSEKREMEHKRDAIIAMHDAALARVAELDKQCRDDVARALGLRPSQERGFAWSYLLASIKSCVKASEDAAQAQHSVPAYVSYTTRPAESLAGIALRQLKEESRWVEIRDINAPAFPDMQSHSYYPAGTVIKLPAAAPGKEGL
ncbi:hypothetical protein QOZ28_17885 [Pseudomonas aeruginosa]|uniref:LysM peptidoglycan-binding domain-containing protein n=1 Tax=Pseudomonas aeruginosa TaxID=287 RepID=UPI0034577A1C